MNLGDLEEKLRQREPVSGSPRTPPAKLSSSSSRAQAKHPRSSSRPVAATAKRFDGVMVCAMAFQLNPFVGGAGDRGRVPRDGRGPFRHS